MSQADIAVIVYGSSNGHQLFNAASSPPAAHANTKHFNGTIWTTVPVSNGVREMLNFLATETGQIIGSLDQASGGASLTALSKGTIPYNALIAAVAAADIAGAQIIMVYDQGGDSTANYVTTFNTLLNDLVADLGITRATFPVFMISRARDESGGAGTDASFQTTQKNIYDCSALQNVFYSHSNVDAVLNVDGLHLTGVSGGNSGRRVAQSICALLLGTETQPANFFMTDSCVIDATKTKVLMTHKMGTDFTPTSSITGFEVSVDAGANYVAATGARTNAREITLTHASLATTQRLVRYQYGKTPDVSACVKDNSALQVPLNYTPVPLATGTAFSSILRMLG